MKTDKTKVHFTLLTNHFNETHPVIVETWGLAFLSHMTLISVRDPCVSSNFDWIV